MTLNQCFGSGSGSGIRRIRYFYSDPDPDPLKNNGSRIRPKQRKLLKEDALNSLHILKANC